MKQLNLRTKGSISSGSVILPTLEIVPVIPLCILWLIAEITRFLIASGTTLIAILCSREA